jgi:hypothetical protein
MAGGVELAGVLGSRATVHGSMNREHRKRERERERVGELGQA